MRASVWESERASVWERESVGESMSVWKRVCGCVGESVSVWERDRV